MNFILLKITETTPAATTTVTQTNMASTLHSTTATVYDTLNTTGNSQVGVVAKKYIHITWCGATWLLALFTSQCKGVDVITG